MGQKKIKEYFDFINLIFQLEEFEIMKRIIFNPDQRLMIDLNMIPNLNDNRDEMKNIIKNMTIQTINQHVREFMNKCKDSSSEIDQNLLEFLFNQ